MASPQELLDRLELFGIRLGLENTRRLLTRVGEPQDGLAVVLVAGTNGKGSSACMLSSIATAAGYRTGLFTSPHLESVRERIRVDGVAISDAQLSESLRLVLAAADRLGEGSATYFEALTVAALVHFARQEVELAVLEVGLGGRLDATNATEPALSLITEIGLDHREHLGETVHEIAAEKAGILRRGSPALAWVTDPAARRSLSARATEVGARLRFVSDDCSIRPLAGEAGVELTTPTAAYRLAPALAGGHQRGNLALAVSAAEALAAAGWRRFGATAVRAGVSGCRWPGRLEWVDLGATGRVLLDGAHNPHAAQALAGYLASIEGGKTLVFGALEGKDVAGMLAPLAGLAERIVLTTPESPRAIEPRQLARHLPGRRAEVIARPHGALAAALRSPHAVVVCGSFYLVGACRSELTRRFGIPPPAVELSTSPSG